MKNFKLLLLAILVVCTACVLTVFASAATVVDEGYVMEYVTYDAENPDNNVANTDGSTNDVRWTLTDDGVLTISSTNSSEMKMNPGAGYSSAYNYKARIPWYTEHASEIYSVVVESSITYLNGACMLGYLPNCTSITFEASSVKLNGSMLFTNLENLTSLKFAGVDYSAYEGKNVIDLRYFTGSASQGFENSCKNLEVTVLSPYVTNMPFGTACLFASTTKANFVVLEGSPAYKFVATDYPAATYRIYMPASNLSYESYTSAIIEGVSDDGYATWEFDAVSGLLTFSKTDKTGWCQFNPKGAYTTFKDAYGSYVENIVFNNKFDKLYSQDGYSFFAGMANLETVSFKAGQRIQNSDAATKGVFQGCTALKAITFGGTLEAGVADFTNVSVLSDDNSAHWLANMFNGCENVEKIILPASSVVTNIPASMISGCKALTAIEVGTNIVTVEEGTFDAWTNSTEGYSALTVTFPLDSAAAEGLESAGLLTVVAPKTEMIVGGQVDQDDTNENDLVWSYDRVTKVLTISGTSTSIVWKDGATSGWNGEKNTTDVSMIPWMADYASEIEKIIITAPITTTPSAIFYKNHALKSVTFPVETVSLGGMAFADCKALVELKTAGADSPDNVIDLRNFTGTVNSQVFETAPANGATLWLPRTGSFNLNNVFGRTGNSYNFVVYPGSVGETSVYNMINSRAARVYGTFDYTYYTEEQVPAWYAEYMETTSYAQGTIGTTTYAVTYDFDIATGKAVIDCNNWDRTLGTDEWKTMITTWKYAIKTIHAKANGKKITANSGGLGDFIELPELTAVIADFNRVQGTLYVKDNDKLEAFGSSSNITKGVLNLSGVTEIDNSGKAIYANMFANNPLFKKLVLPKAGILTIKANAFTGCTGLTSIVIPEGCVIETVEVGAFAGLENAVTIYDESGNEITAAALLADGVLPEGSKIYTETPSTGEGLTSSVVFDGWKVRTSGYNGLRGVFYADNEKIDANEENGWTLVELGALLSTTKSKNANGVKVYYDETNGVTKDSHVRIYPTLRGGNTEDNIVGKTLTGADVVTDNTYFAVSVVKYAANYTVEVYMAGYEVWKDASGNVVIMYTDYGTDDSHDDTFTDTSIYEMSLAMYKAGTMSAKIDTKGIVWDTLVKGGALTLTKGTNYVTEDDYTDGEAINMLTGEPFGDTFVVANVPMVDQSVATTTDGDVTTKTLNFANCGVTYTVLNDCFNSGKYVLVYRDDTEVNGTVIPGTSPWGSGFHSQLETSWYPGNTDKGINAVAASRPNPKYTTNFYGSCNTVIIDYGVTGTASEAFKGSGGITYMYHETFKKLSSGAWQGTTNVQTVYLAGTTPVTGRADISGLTSVDTAYLFNSGNKITEIHMPDVSAWVKKDSKHVVDTQFAQAVKLNTLWVGDGDRIEGAINLSNTDIVSINAAAFTAVTATKVILPETATAISDTAFKATTLEIRQAAKVDTIETYCAGKGYTYVDLDGAVFVALEESEGWSGIIVK